MIIWNQFNLLIRYLRLIKRMYSSFIVNFKNNIKEKLNNKN